MRKCPICATSYEDVVSFCGLDGAITIEEQDPSDYDPRLGLSLGEYTLVARVADGGMGRVYEGYQPHTRQRVAVKVLHDSIATNAVAVERFNREYETAKEFDHPGIVNVLDFGETDDGSHFLTMEYLDGLELSRELKEGGAFSPARMFRVLIQLADALDYAHSFGVVHRDLKPDNVFLCRRKDGEDIVKVLDFGSVKLQMETGPKLTAVGTTLGSPFYMSPEQAMGKLDLDQRTDVFAVAAITWELATGRIAFEGKSVAEILTKITTEDPSSASELDPSIPAAFDTAILTGVAKDKSYRPGTVSAFVETVADAYKLRVDVLRGMSTSEISEQLEAAKSASQASSLRTFEADSSAVDTRPSTSMTKSPQWLVIAVVVAVIVVVAFVVAS